MSDKAASSTLPQEAIHMAARGYCIDRRAALGAVLLPQGLKAAAAGDRIMRFPLTPKGEVRRKVYYAHTLGVDIGSILRATPRPVNVPKKRRADQEQALHARSALLLAILEEIERSMPGDFASAEEAREFLLAAGRTSRVLSRSVQGRQILGEAEPEWVPTQRAAMRAEREAYLDHVAHLSVDAAMHLPPVPYRHVLSEAERDKVIAPIARRWNVHIDQECWFPLRLEPLPPDVLALQDAYFYVDLGIHRLREILFEHRVRRVWEIHQSALFPDYEMDARLCDFFSIGGEVYWFSPEVDWLVYQSHEESLTFAGAWLVDEVRSAWPNWRQRVYVDWNYR